MEEKGEAIALGVARITRAVMGIFAACLAAVFFFALAPDAEAATLYLSPSNGTYAVGQTFTVGVYVSSTDMAINAYSGQLFFPQNIIDVTSVSKSGITSLWVSEPTYSNAEGFVSFEGVVLNPGFTGSGGTIMSVTFRAKAAGTVPIKFTSSSVLANDGLGTNILSGVGNASFTIGAGTTPAPTPTPTPTPTPAPAPTGVPAAPVISSSTHPVPDAWVSDNDPVFSWKLPAGATGVNFTADHSAGTDPGSVSDGVLTTYKYSDVEDGTWYLHLKFQNALGWGATSHYRFQIDTSAPAPFEIDFLDGTMVSVPSPRLSFFTQDSGSGLDYYVIKVDEVEVGRVKSANWTASSEFTLPALASGDKFVSVEAVDRAGNVISSKGRLSVVLPAELEPATVTDSAQVSTAQFPGLQFITLLAALLLLLALFFAAFVLWRSSSSWGIILIGRRKNTLLRRLIRLRHYVARHFRELEQDIVATNYSSVEKKTAARVAKNLHDLQAELNKEIDYLSE